MNKRIILTVIQVILSIALIVFIFFQAEEFFSQVDWSQFVEHWLAVIVSGLFFLCGYFFMALHWQKVCQLFETDINKKQWLAYFASQPYKYLPTSIFTFSFRAVYAKKLGLNLKKSSEAQLVENANLIGSSLTLGLLFFVLATNILYGVIIAIFLTIVVGLLWQHKTFIIPIVSLKLDLREWLKSVSIVSFGWIVMGLGFYILSLNLESKVDILTAIAANSLATGFGILAVFAPGGIGIRELVFSFFMYASTTILLWRLTTFVVDIVVGVFSIWAISRSQK